MCCISYTCVICCFENEIVAKMHRLLIPELSDSIQKGLIIKIRYLY